MSAPKGYTKKEVRICNICQLPEPPEHYNEHDQNLYCLSHSVHASYWNLSPSQDANGNRMVCYKDYQKLYLKQQARAVNLPPRGTRK